MSAAEPGNQIDEGEKMIDKVLLGKYLTEYKQIFLQRLDGKEDFKWIAVKQFQDSWKINAPDFAEMLNRSLSKTSSLLANANNFPAKMIVLFAKNAPEEVRGMFMELFNTDDDIVSRIEKFKSKSAILLKKYGSGQHYQNENAVSTYLWLRYPEKYYIYKFSVAKSVAQKLNSDYQFKMGRYADNVHSAMKMYDEICEELGKDDELVKLLHSSMDSAVFPDPKLHTLTIDFCFYLYNTGADAQVWLPKDYSPNITAEEWLELLNDKSIFTASALEIMRRMKDCGGQATCTQLSAKYGESKNFYNSGSSALARRVADKTHCPLYENEPDDSKLWPILYVGKQAEKEQAGNFVWKLRDELSQALDKVDLSSVELYAAKPVDDGARGYWWLNVNPRIWSVSSIAAGETQSYTLMNESGNKRRIYQNFLDAKMGDPIIFYESTPVKQVVALGRISAGQDGEKISFEKTEGLSAPIDYSSLKSCPELEHMEYFNSPQGSLFKLTEGEYNFILDVIRDENPLSAETQALAKYDKSDFLDEVFMTEDRYETLTAVLLRKKNVILQGAPGVGKTFAARRLAYSIMGEKDDSRIEFVQFHQNYSYEDFMMGYKPTENGFALKYGVFYRFCQKASNQPDKEFFFIIDEINRGNLSKIFGELLMLIERDYRGTKTTLAYSGQPFSVPENVYIIGMMNTADRSLAMIDYALRRRFSFFELKPGFDSDGFAKYQDELNDDTFNELIARVKELNHEIAADRSLGSGFCIGHSYFCGQNDCSDEWLRTVVDYDILPMLSEYWFDDSARIQKWENILHGVFQ